MVTCRWIPWRLAALVLVAADASAQQTIVLFRHGEKPAAGLGQLNLSGSQSRARAAAGARSQVRPAKLSLCSQSVGKNHGPCRLIFLRSAARDD